MSYSWNRRWLFAAALLFLSACGPKTPPVPEHIAALRFENLGADSSADWMGRAFSEIIDAELSGVPGGFVISAVRMHQLDRTLGVRPVSAPGISTERTMAMLSGANRLAYGEYSVAGGKVDARLTLEDPQTGRTVAVLSASAPDVITAATALARALSPHAAAYDTRNPEAVKHYITAAESSDPAVKLANAQAAIAADPNFGPPYRAVAEDKAQQQDVNGALAVLDEALARGNAIPAAERARIELTAAGLRNDSAASEHALGDLAKALPGDVENWKSLATTAFARHDYPQAAEAYQKALQLQPDDIGLLNQLSYSQAFSGNLAGALTALRRYQTLRPADANPLDSMGDVQLMYGHLREAEDLYLQADKKDRKLLSGGDLLKAAMARLMTGDVPGASALAKQFTAARTEMHDQAAAIHDAKWAWISGNRKVAREQLLTFAHGVEAGPQKDLASRAYTELAIWSLAAGDRAGAAQLSMKASDLAGSQTAASDAVVARFLSQPSASPAEWTARADQLFRNFPQSGLKNLTLAYALLLDRQFPAAAVALRRQYEGPDIEPGLPILLAWSLMESGHDDEAAPLLRFNPIPPYTGMGLYTPSYFPRLYELRARLAAKSGRADEARSERLLFEKLTGN